MIKIVVATSNNGVIGKDNKLLWRQSEDLKRFKELTTGNKVVMGRKTYESIGKPLPGRDNYVITRSLNEIDGCKVFKSFEEVDKLEGDIFIIGGGEIYEKFITLADEIYLTIIDCDVDGDTFFNLDSNGWIEISSESFKKDDKNEYNYTFKKLIRWKN
jgi:dihydrofolate reductase